MKFSSVANRARYCRGTIPVTQIWHNEYMQDETITDPPKKEGCVIKSAQFGPGLMSILQVYVYGKLS
jgi:hypothetical protein